MNRRRFITTAASLSATCALLDAAGAAANRLGICSFSCRQRWRLAKRVDAVEFYHYASELGAEGVQTPLRGCGPKTIRDLVEQTGGYYEGDLRLPKSEAGLEAFEAEVLQSREAGAAVARAVFTNGRPYEAFSTLEAFERFHERCKRTLALIEPVLNKHRLRLAIENHKDHTTEEMVGLMLAISSEWIGVLVDTGTTSHFQRAGARRGRTEQSRRPTMDETSAAVMNRKPSQLPPRSHETTHCLPLPHGFCSRVRGESPVAPLGNKNHSGHPGRGGR